MKWARRRRNLSSASPSSASSPRPPPASLLSSWISKFKKMGVGVGQSNHHPPAKPTPNSKISKGRRPNYPSSRVASPVYEGDNGFWRLSFGDKNIGVEGSSSRDVPGLARHEMNGDEAEIQAPVREQRNFDDMVSGVRRMRELHRRQAELRTPRRRKVKKERNSGNSSENISEVKGTDIEDEAGLLLQENCENSELENMVELEAELKGSLLHERNAQRESPSLPKTHRRFPSNYSMQTLPLVEEECEFSGVNSGNLEKFSPLVEGEREFPDVNAGNLEKLSPNSTLEIREGSEITDDSFKKNEKQRKSLYISRGLPPRRRSKQSGHGIRVRSPRAAAIKFEPRDHSRSPIDHKDNVRKAKRSEKEERRKLGQLERFAVTKCSYNPQRDFRESMLEMIAERRIHRSEEMEELLACYLTLNSDEHHDLIIKVFRQVWFELNQASFW